MRLLLDTHVYLWALQDSPRLTRAFAEAIRNPANTVFVSAVCVWEAAIKQAVGRLELGPDVDLAGDIGASGFEELHITAIHAARSAALPRIHADPFDRLIVAQALEENLRLVSVDAEVRAYPGLVVLEP